MLFVLTNIAILVVLSIVLRLLGVGSMLDDQGIGLNYWNLLIFAAVFGFGGSFISLAMSKWVAKRATGAVVIEQPRTPTEIWLVDTVKKQADMAGIGMPEVAIFASPSPNAFATGMNRNKALVAVSDSLLKAMKKEEVEAVLGHEVSHVANGDMVTLTLIQGVINTFVIFISRIIGYFVDRVILKNEEGLGLGYFVTSIVAQIILGILASIIVMWFSRRREFSADTGGAKLSSTKAMISALERLKKGEQEPLPEQVAAFGISGKSGGFKALFMTHPPLEDRIEALKRASGM